MARKVAPQHWVSEFGAEFRVPATLDQLAAKGVLEDMSWHNDVYPSFGKTTSRGYEVRVWIGHPDRSQRDPGEKRYYVNVDDSDAHEGEPQTTNKEHEGIGTNSFSRALSILFEKIDKYS